jgi:hypothetical protein
VCGVPDADTAEPTRAAGPDRRRDVAGWLLTPLVALVLGPAVTAAVTVLLVIGGGLGELPEVCARARPDNRCEEVTLGLAGQHMAVFGGLWLLLWVLPWWRGLRGVRVGLAVLAIAVLVAAPLRLN